MSEQHICQTACTSQDDKMGANCSRSCRCADSCCLCTKHTHAAIFVACSYTPEACSRNRVVLLNMQFAEVYARAWSAMPILIRMHTCQAGVMLHWHGCCGQCKCRKNCDVVHDMMLSYLLYVPGETTLFVLDVSNVRHSM